MQARFLFRRLAPCDRLLFLLTVVWAIVAIPARYSRVSGTARLWPISVIILWAAIAGVVAWSILRRRHRPAAYGFSFESGSLASLAILAAIHVYLLITGKLVLTASDGFLWKAFGAFMEEIAFRAIAIDNLILLMKETKLKAFWAILASSVLWSIPHAITKAPAQLFGGIFLGGPSSNLLRCRGLLFRRLAFLTGAQPTLE